MAKVKLTTCLAGAVVYNPGDTYECSYGEAVRLIEAGFAVPLAEPEIERAVKRPVRAPVETRRIKKKG